MLIAWRLLFRGPAVQAYQFAVIAAAARAVQDQSHALIRKDDSPQVPMAKLCPSIGPFNRSAVLGWHVRSGLHRVLH